MKTKIVEHIAGNAAHALNQADLEATNLRDKYAALLADSSKGIGLDFAVLREKLREARELIELLA